MTAGLIDPTGRRPALELCTEGRARPRVGASHGRGVARRTLESERRAGWNVATCSLPGGGSGAARSFGTCPEVEMCGAFGPSMAPVAITREATA